MKSELCGMTYHEILYWSSLSTLPKVQPHSGLPCNMPALLPVLTLIVIGIEQITERECISCQFQSQNDPMYIISTILHCYQHMLSSGSGWNCTTSGERGGEGKEEKGKIFFHFFFPEHSLIRSILHPVPTSICIYRYNTFYTAEWNMGVLVSVLWLVKKRADKNKGKKQLEMCLNSWV